MHGNALLFEGGGTKHGFDTWLLCRSIRYPIENVFVPSFCTTIWSGSPGSIRNWTFTPFVPGGMTRCGSVFPSLLAEKMICPFAGVPYQTMIDQWVVVVTCVELVAKIISQRSSRSGNWSGAIVNETAATSSSAKPPWAM